MLIVPLRSASPQSWAGTGFVGFAARSMANRLVAIVMSLIEVCSVSARCVDDALV